MPQIPVNLTFPSPDGKPITQDNSPNSPPITVKDALIIAATNEFPEDQTASPNLVTEKLHRYSIYLKLLKADAAEVIHFTAEEAAHLKQRVARCFSVIVAGPLFHLLDGIHPSQKPQAAVQPPKEVADLPKA